jgi:hypothetical protein
MSLKQEKRETLFRVSFKNMHKFVYGGNNDSTCEIKLTTSPPVSRYFSKCGSLNVPPWPVIGIALLFLHNSFGQKLVARRPRERHTVIEIRCEEGH